MLNSPNSNSRINSIIQLGIVLGLVMGGILGSIAIPIWVVELGNHIIVIKGRLLILVEGLILIRLVVVLISNRISQLRTLLCKISSDHHNKILMELIPMVHLVVVAMEITRLLLAGVEDFP